MTYLFEHAQKKEEENLKFQARINGIEIKETREHSPKISSKKDSSSNLLFKDPKEYEHLSQEEKEKLTKEMMQKFSVFASDFNKPTRQKNYNG